MNKEKFLKAIAGTQFEKDLKVSLIVNGSDMGRGMWNLIVSIRDCKLFSKGIKAHRNFRLSDVKWYFGIKGGADKMAETLESYLEFLKAEGKNAIAE